MRQTRPDRGRLLRRGDAIKPRRVGRDGVIIKGGRTGAEGARGRREAEH